MAKRPIYIVDTDGDHPVRVEQIEFEWHPGMAISQTRKSINSLHDAARKIADATNILEISKSSQNSLGVSLSAFNLMIRTQVKGSEFSVECAYQASKVFENGGPFADLLDKSSGEAKRDPRLKSSGRLLKFRFFKYEWELLPRHAFYNWLYLNALWKNTELGDELLKYSSFTDIAFNPAKSINCQAHAAALFVSLKKRGLLTEAVLANKEQFLAIAGDSLESNTDLLGP